MTREEWLQNGVDALRERFRNAGYPIPDTARVTRVWLDGPGAPICPH